MTTASQPRLGDAAPVVNALKRVSLTPGGHRLHLVRLFVLIGALVGMISSILVFQLGQARVWFAMSRDRLLPDAFSKLHPKFRTPAFATWFAGILVAIPAGVFDVGSFAEMSHIGTLLLERHMTLAVAESFTGGLIASRIVALRRPFPSEARSGVRKSAASSCPKHM